ncbi:MAG: deoxyribose-phosphate aldolase [Acidimicrobiales bacterium]
MAGSPLRSVAEVAAAIDHALLRPELTVDAVRAGCAVAARYAVASVCCKPADVSLCHSILAGSTVEVGTVVGFPHGSSLGSVKRFETERALDDGATEIDVVLNVGRLRSCEDAWVADELAGVVDACRGRGIVKVILECALLTDAEKVRACGLAVAAGADYVKTSTGYAAHGATLEDVRLLRASAPAPVRVKAAGGISTLDDLLAMLDAGASRVGCSATAALLDELADRHAAR